MALLLLRGSDVGRSELRSARVPRTIRHIARAVHRCCCQPRRAIVAPRCYVAARWFAVRRVLHCQGAPRVRRRSAEEVLRHPGISPPLQRGRLRGGRLHPLL